MEPITFDSIGHAKGKHVMALFFKFVPIFNVGHWIKMTRAQNQVVSQKVIA